MPSQLFKNLDFVQGKYVKKESIAMIIKNSNAYQLYSIITTITVDTIYTKINNESKLSGNVMELKLVFIYHNATPGHAKLINCINNVAV